MKRSFSLAFFFFVYVLVLLLTTPASLLSPLVRQATNGKVILANCRGSLWEGSSTPALASPTGNLLSLPSVVWKFFPVDLLRAKLHVGLNLQNGSQPMDFFLSAEGARLERLFVPISASLLGEMSPQLKPLGLSGIIELQSAELTWNKGGFLGTVSGKWSEAGTSLVPISPIGQYTLHLTANGEDFKINLTTDSGPLIFAGEGTLSLSRGLTFNGTAKAESSHQEGLRELLQHLGPDAGNGKRLISIAQNSPGI